jgi:diguanylate cyclase (GGDEF)-like protein
MRQEAQLRGLAVLQALAVPCAVALANREIETLDAVLAQFAEGEDKALGLEWVAIIDTQGTIVAHTDPRMFGQRKEDAFTRRALQSQVPTSLQNGEALEAQLTLSMPIVSGLRWGTAMAEVSLTSVERRIARNRMSVLLVSAIVALGLTLVLAQVLARTVLQPLENMVGAAEAMAQGQLSARVPTREGGDELALLGQVFNDMAHQVEWQTRELESKVAARTVELERINRTLETAVTELEGLARTDGLTSLLNHRAFQESLRGELRRANRQHSQSSLLLIDVDHFKTYNDTHGHPAGDQVLRKIARLFTDALRGSDIVARYGGEEFAVLLLDTDGPHSREVAEKLRRAIRDHIFAGASESQPGGRLTISVGLASHPADAQTPAELLSLADKALYRAKNGGRDQVIAWTPESASS